MDSYAWFLDLFNRVRALEVHAGIPSPDQAKAPGMEDTPAVCDMNHGPICIACGSLLVEAQAEAARLTRELAAERELRRQDAVRLVAAAENAGIPYGDCDTADDLAEALLCEKAAREKAEAAFAAMAAALRECHAHAHNYGLHLSAGHPMRTAQIQLINATSAKVRAALSPASGSALLARLAEAEAEAARLTRELAEAKAAKEKAEREVVQLRASECAHDSEFGKAIADIRRLEAEAARLRPLGEAARRRIETPPCCDGYDSDCECACHDRDREADARLRAALAASGEATP